MEELSSPSSSRLTRSSTALASAARAASRGSPVMTCVPARASAHLPHIDEMTDERSGCGHLRRDQMSAALEALTTLEIAVRGRGGALAGLELVGVHAQAHRAAGLAPFEAGGEEDLVETFFLGLLLHQAGAGDDHGIVERAGDRLTLDDLGDGAQILDAAIGAGTDPDHVERDLG